jgi:methionyl-tRNA formyltransferase
MKKIIFWGSPEFALPALEAVHKLGLISAVVTKADKPQGRGLNLEACPVKRRTLELGLPVLSPLKLDNTFIAELQSYLPATFLIVAYGKIIPQTVLDVSQLPSLNIHPSLLPKYRGPSPIQSALLNGETETGVSLMQLDAEMDHGPLIEQILVPIDPRDYFPQLHDKLAHIAADVLKQSLQGYLDGSLNTRAQNDDAATYCQLLTKEQGQIDWNNTAETIRNQIRAFTPWPSCYFSWNGKSVKIIEADVVFSVNDKKPGELYRHGDELYVNCGLEALSILKLQLEGKREMSVQEFLNGYGDKL